MRLLDFLFAIVETRHGTSLPHKKHEMCKIDENYVQKMCNFAENYVQKM